jgi:diguanylate cyclase (GGDEF)-like protein/PAS domain S-box-containing protein
LILVVVLAYRFPIHVRQETKIYVESVALYLMVALLPLPVAIAAAGVGKLGGELAARSITGNYPSDIASQIGRWMLIAAAGGGVLQIPVGSGPFHTVPVVAVAIVLWLGDMVSVPVLLCPITGERPWTIIRTSMREAGPAEAAQYLIGILGALAAMQARWALALLFLPTTLMYLAFKTAKDMHESTRQLLVSVVETSPDAILLLDTRGSVLLANRQAATLLGYDQPEDLVGVQVFDAISEDDRTRAQEDIQRVFGDARVPSAEYLALRCGGESFTAELSWSRIAGRQGTARAITCILRDITDRKQTEEALTRQALHDGLTGLPNRMLFRERLEQAIARSHRDGLPLSVFLLDLNGFKQVNDTYGHHAGDVVLKEVGVRLHRILRETDTVARLGGDEFAILLSGTGLEGAELVARRVVDVINQPIAADGLLLDVGTSIGIALYGQDGHDPHTLLDRADAAMYVAKRGKHGYRFAEAQQLAS